VTTSTLIEPTAVLLSDLAETISVTMSNGTKALKGYSYEPAAFDDIPAAAVGAPELNRGSLDAGERELGSDDWYLDYPVSLYFDLDEAAKAQGQMVEALEAFTKAIDDDPSLGSALIDDCKLTNAEPFVEDGRGRTLCGYLCTVSVLRRNPY
jgi:hypothetical protein